MEKTGRNRLDTTGLKVAGREKKKKTIARRNSRYGNQILESEEIFNANLL